MSTSTAPARSPTSMVRTAFAPGGAAAADRAAGARSPDRTSRARVCGWVRISLLLEVQRLFPGQPERRLGLLAGPVRLHRPLGDDDLVRADAGDDAAVLPDAGPLAQRVAHAGRRLDHRQGIGQAGDDGDEPELVDLEAPERRVAAGDHRA